MDLYSCSIFLFVHFYLFDLSKAFERQIITYYLINFIITLALDEFPCN